MTATSKEVEILEKRYNDLSIEMVNGQNEVEGLRTISKNLKKENTDFQKKNDVLDKGIEENQIILKQQKDDHDIYIQWQKKDFEDRKTQQMKIINTKNDNALKNIKEDESILAEIQKANDEKHILVEKEADLDKKESELNKKASDLVILDDNIKLREADTSRIESEQKILWSQLSEKQIELNTREDGIVKKEHDIDTQVINIASIQKDADKILVESKLLMAKQDTRASELSTKETTLDKTQTVLLDKEKELTDREVTLAQNESSLNAREKILEEGMIDLKKARVDLYLAMKKQGLEDQIKALWLKLE